MWFVKWDEKEEFRNRIIIQIFLICHEEYQFIKYCEGTTFFAKYMDKLVLVTLFTPDKRLYKKYSSIYGDFSADEYHRFSFIYRQQNTTVFSQNDNINFIFNESFVKFYNEYINNPIEFLENNLIKNSVTPLLYKYTVENINNDMSLFIYKGNKKVGTEEYEYLKDLIDNQVTYIDPTTFNDPFDCDVELENQNHIMKIIYDILSQKYIPNLGKKIPYDDILEISFIKENMENLVFEKINNDDAPNIKMIGKIVDLILDRFITSENVKFSHEYLLKMKNYIFNAVTNFINVKNKFRVLCATKKYDDILMWAYYGNSHRGYCFEHGHNNIIIGTNQMFKSGICYYGYVNYSTKRPIIKIPNKKYKNFHSFASIIEEHIDLLFTKYKGWEHEEEYRFVVLTPETYKNILGQYINIQSPILNYYIGCESDGFITANYNKTAGKYKLKKDTIEYKLIK